MNDLGLSLTDLYEAAARAAINERCAPAYLHDVRGSLQALFGALELLGMQERKQDCLLALRRHIFVRGQIAFARRG